MFSFVNTSSSSDTLLNKILFEKLVFSYPGCEKFQPFVIHCSTLANESVIWVDKRVIHNSLMVLISKIKSQID